MDYSRYQTLLIEKDADGVAVVTLNRPEKRNAVSLQMHQELESIFVDLSNDDDVRSVVLTGAGDAFCAGGDVEGMKTGEFRPGGPAVPFHMVRRLVVNLLEVEQPIVAAVNGDGGVVIWPWLVGMARAKEYLLTGQWIDGREAERIGLVNYAVPQEQVLPRAMEIARRLAQGAPLAIRWTKFSLNKILRDHVNLALDSSMFLEAATMSSEDLEEAARAFFEKRKPKFKGR